MGDSVWYSLPVEDWYRVVDFMDGFYREHGINMYYKHQLFGYSDWLGTGNGDEVECEQNRRGLSRFRKPPQTIRREIEEAAKGWLLLLQVSDEGDRGSVRFGDVGAIHYWIRHRDLECHDFSAACATMASH
jgi:hypothetical protein